VEFLTNEAPSIVLDALPEAVQVCGGDDEICLSYSLFDPDGPEGLAVTLLSGPGDLDALNNRICFTPVTSGLYSFVAEVADPCGLTDIDSTQVEVIVSASPECNLPANHRIILCEPAEICFPISSTDQVAGGVVCTIIDGAGEVRGNNWCYLAEAPGAVTVSLRCTDICDNTCQIQRTYVIEIDPQDCDGGSFSAGDLDYSGTLDVLDLVHLAAIVHRSGRSGSVPTAASVSRGGTRGDVNCDGAVNETDFDYLADCLFREGPVPCYISGSRTPSRAGRSNPDAGTKSRPAGRSGGNPR
jgi:hypothetical protein